MCCGKGFIPLGDSENVCNVHGFHPSMPAIENVSIRTCATAYDHADGSTYILVFGQALWFGDDLEESLACPSQIRAFNNIVCLNPKQFTDGKSLHGIHSNSDDVTMHFKMHGCVSYLPIRTPTPDEMQRCQWIHLTSEEQWEPYHDNFARAEEAMLAQTLHKQDTYQDTSVNIHGRIVSATSSKDHRSSVTPESLARRWGTSLDVATKTLRVTTQQGIRRLDSNLTRRFRTRQTHLRYSHVRTDVFSDTLFSDVKSARGYTCGQLFVTAQDFAEFYPMRNKSEAPYKLDLFCKSYGLPQTLITDNALEETKGEWEKVVKEYLLKQRTTEPYSGWQNRAELEIRELMKHHRRIMHRNRCPESLWCYGMEYTKSIRQLAAKPNLDWRTPMEVLTGETPDCTEYIEFDFYGWVKYKEHKSKTGNDISLGRWLGVAHDIGQAMTYWILKENGEVVARSTVRPITPEELRDDEEKEHRKNFMLTLKQHVGDFNPELINTDASTTNDELQDPLFNDDEDTTEDDTNKDNTSTTSDINENTPGPEPLLYAEVFLPHGDREEIAKVIGRKRNADGNYIGRKHQNPMLDSRVFVVEFPDGDQKDVAYNIIAEHLFSQVDEEGNQYRIFKEIVNHRKTKRAVERSDQYRIDRRTGRRTKKSTTAGWDLEVEWKDGSTSWIPLKELKETNAVEVAQYAVANRIDEEPAFDWWVRHLLKKKDRLIKASKRRQVRIGYKFGIKIPNTVEEALELDKENRDTLWYDAIQKEMQNVKVAFEVLQEGKAPPGYKRIPCRMIFTLKMDFTRKAQLVAGGHVTDPPATSTYSSVVSRESVRIMFLIAALNDLDIMAGDIGNAYLNAKTQEKVFIITGPEFGEDAGKVALIVRALYGLKSSGAAWHAHFAEHLTDMGFTPCKSDPDVWRREATKKDKTEYYEYMVVYVDDILVISERPGIVLDLLVKDYHYKVNGVGPPDTFLGAKIGRYDIGDLSTWYISAEAYLEKALPNIELRFGKLDKMFSKSRLDTPAPTDFHPEIDSSDFLDADMTALYQSYIGILRWTVELGSIDIAHFTGTMAKFSVAPREGHLTAVIRCMGYLKKHLRSRIVFNPKQVDFSDLTWTSKDWDTFYPDVKGECIPHDMPTPRGKSVQINMFCDAAHATDLITRRSTTGIIFFLNGTPINWYSKRQNTIESSTFGSEFVALKIAAEMNDALRYKLRMFGIPIDGPTNGFCDNQSVVTNVVNPESTLKKRHNSIAYHKVRKCIASKALRIRHEDGKENCSDVLTKFLPSESHFSCCKCMLYR